MKRILVIILIIFIIILMSFDESEKTSYVFDEITEYNYELIYVKIKNLNTDNFKSYFKEVRVILIFPYINDVYKDKISISYENIDGLKDYYIDKMKSKGYYIEANSYMARSIPIEKVLIYSSLKELKSLFSCDDIDFSYNDKVYVKHC